MVPSTFLPLPHHEKVKMQSLIYEHLKWWASYLSPEMEFHYHFTSVAQQSILGQGKKDVQEGT